MLGQGWIQARIITAKVPHPRPPSLVRLGREEDSMTGRRRARRRFRRLPTMARNVVTTTTTAANTGVAPFRILSVSQTSSGAHFTTNHHNRNGSSSDGIDGPKTNAMAITPPKGACSSGSPQLSVGAPNGGASPSEHLSHHPLPLASASTSRCPCPSPSCSVSSITPSSNDRHRLTFFSFNRSSFPQY